MTAGDWPIAIATLCALLGASFVFSGSETAFFSLQGPDRERMSRGTRAERQVVHLLGQRSALITTLLLGNEISNITMSATTTAIFAATVPDMPWLNIVLLTPVLVLLSEITPKITAFRFRQRWARTIVWPLTVWFWFATPARVFFAGIVTALARFLGVGEKADGVVEEELLVYVDHVLLSGELDPSERDIIESVFEFDEHTVERLMTPRPDIFSVPLTIEWNDLLARCKTSGQSRIPVTGATPDDVVGVLLLKDLLKFRKAPHSSPRELRSMLLAPIFTPASRPADRMLREFLERRFHMAFVVDEHGTLIGLVTLDDLLGELLGGDDEATEDSEIARLRPDSMTVKASIDLQDFVEETGIEPPEGNYHTLGGYVFHQLGRLPRRGDAVVLGDHKFVVSGMEGRRITELIVTSGTPKPADDRDQEAV